VLNGDKTAACLATLLLHILPQPCHPHYRALGCTTFRRFATIHNFAIAYCTLL
jgi:hypothetical protein